MSEFTTGEPAGSAPMSVRDEGFMSARVALDCSDQSAPMSVPSDRVRSRSVSGTVSSNVGGASVALAEKDSGVGVGDEGEFGFSARVVSCPGRNVCVRCAFALPRSLALLALVVARRRRGRLKIRDGAETLVWCVIMEEPVAELDTTRIDALLDAGDLLAAREALTSVADTDARFAVLRIKLGLYDGSLAPGAAMQQLIHLMRRDENFPGAKDLYQKASNAAFQARESNVALSHPPPPTRTSDRD